MFLAVLLSFNIRLPASWVETLSPEEPPAVEEPMSRNPEEKPAEEKLMRNRLVEEPVEEVIAPPRQELAMPMLACMLAVVTMAGPY